MEFYTHNYIQQNYSWIAGKLVPETMAETKQMRENITSICSNESDYIAKSLSLLEKLECTHIYAYLFTLDETVYTVVTEKKLKEFLRLTVTSSGKNSLTGNPANCPSVRLNLRSKTAKREMLKIGTTIRTTSVQEYEKWCWNFTQKHGRQNSGVLAEAYVAEILGDENHLTKDNTPFWEDGDVNCNGTSIQVKNEYPTFICEASLLNGAIAKSGRKPKTKEEAIKTVLEYIETL